MCMKLSLFAYRKFAKEPITCYKVVGAVPWDLRETKFMSFYYDWEYELGVVTYHRINRQAFDVHEGYHSYLNISDAMLFRDKMGNSKWIRIVECTIPKDSEYYVGKQRAYTSAYDAPGYVSNYLIIKKVL